MRIDVQISPDVEAALRKQAADTGLSVSVIAARLLERAVRTIHDLVEISGPIEEAFKASGMTEDQLSKLLEREKACHARGAPRELPALTGEQMGQMR